MPIDAELRAAVQGLADDSAQIRGGIQDTSVEGTEGDDAERPRPRVDAKLSVREVQARLRSGASITAVADDAGVAEQWVERFAPPVRAEQRQIVERALAQPLERARAGESVEPLGAAVAAAMVERGVTLTADGFAHAWTSRLVGRDHWVIEFHFTQRGRARTIGWTFDAAEGRLTTTDRTASQIGFVAPSPEATPTGKTGRSRTSGDRQTDRDARSTRGDGRPDSATSTRAVRNVAASTAKAHTARPAVDKKSTKAPAAKKAPAKRKAPATKKAVEKQIEVEKDAAALLPTVADPVAPEPVLPEPAVAHPGAPRTIEVIDDGSQETIGTDETIEADPSAPDVRAPHIRVRARRSAPPTHRAPRRFVTRRTEPDDDAPSPSAAAEPPSNPPTALAGDDVDEEQASNGRRPRRTRQLRAR